MSDQQLRNALPELLTRELLRQGALRRDLPGLCPDSNLLTAYVERRLDGAEQAVVAQHLNRCADCRSTVMLAVRAGLTPSADAVAAPAMLVARPASSRLLPWVAAGAMAAALAVVAVTWRKPVAPSRSPVEDAQLVRPRLGVTARPAERPHPRAAAATPAPVSPSTVASPVPSEIAVLTPAVAVPAPVAMRPVVARRNSVVRQGFVTLTPPPRRPASMVPVSSEPEVISPQPVPGATALAMDEPMVAMPPRPAHTTPAPEVPMSAAFAGSSRSVASAQMALPTLSSALQSNRSSMMKTVEDGLGFSKFLPHAHPVPVWRISAQGQLQHSAGKGLWIPVRVQSNTRLLTLAAAGNSLWVGGDNGLLYHSSDGGANWSALRLNANGQLLQDSIVGIHFRDARQGELTTSSGNRWLTLDGGQLWHLVGKVPSLLHTQAPAQTRH